MLIHALILATESEVIRHSASHQHTRCFVDLVNDMFASSRNQSGSRIFESGAEGPVGQNIKLGSHRIKFRLMLNTAYSCRASSSLTVYTGYYNSQSHKGTVSKNLYEATLSRSHEAHELLQRNHLKLRLRARGQTFEWSCVPAPLKQPLYKTNSYRRKHR